MCGLLVLAMLNLMGCANEKTNRDEIVMTVNEESVPLGVVNLAMCLKLAENNYQQQVETQLGLAPGQLSVEEGLIRQEVLDRIEKMYLVKIHAEDYGVEITAEEKAKILQTALQFIEDNDANVIDEMGVIQQDVEEYLELETYYAKAHSLMAKDEDFDSLVDKWQEEANITIDEKTLDKLKDVEDESRYVLVEKEPPSDVAEPAVQDTSDRLDRPERTEPSDRESSDEFPEAMPKDALREGAQIEERTGEVLEPPRAGERDKKVVIEKE